MHHSLVYGPAVQLGRKVFDLMPYMAWCEEYAIALMLLYVRNLCSGFLYELTMQFSLTIIIGFESSQFSLPHIDWCEYISLSFTVN
jgi:hypothetical protein